MDRPFGSSRESLYRVPTLPTSSNSRIPLSVMAMSRVLLSRKLRIRKTCTAQIKSEVVTHRRNDENEDWREKEHLSPRIQI